MSATDAPEDFETARRRMIVERYERSFRQDADRAREEALGRPSYGSRIINADLFISLSD